MPDNKSNTPYDPPCAGCGMHTLTPNEYHPYAACILFQAGMKADEVRLTSKRLWRMENGNNNTSRCAVCDGSGNISAVQKTGGTTGYGWYPMPRMR
jgi:hypothetical protein